MAGRQHYGPKRARPSGGLHRLICLLIALGGFGFGAGLVVGLPQVSAAEPSTRPADPAERRMKGSLVICGGGRLPGSVLDCFLELAGGPQARIVLIPTAESDYSLRDVSQRAEPW